MDAAFPADQSQQVVADAQASAVLDQAPNGLDQTPQDSAPPTEPNDPAAELARVQADYQRTQGELAQVRQRAEAADQRIASYEAQVRENTVRAWQNAKNELDVAVQQMEPDEAVAAYKTFSEARERALITTSQQALTEKDQEVFFWKANSFADELIATNGLQRSPDVISQLVDVGMQTRNPQAMIAKAEAIKNGAQPSAELKKAQQELEILKSLVAGKSVSGAWKTGGGNGNAPSASIYDVKSPDYDERAHYEALTTAGGRSA